MSSASTGATRDSPARVCSLQNAQRKTFRSGALAPVSHRNSSTMTGRPQVGQRDVNNASSTRRNSPSPRGRVARVARPASKWRRSGGRSTTSASRRVSAVDSHTYTRRSALMALRAIQPPRPWMSITTSPGALRVASSAETTLSGGGGAKRSNAGSIARASGLISDESGSAIAAESIHAVT